TNPARSARLLTDAGWACFMAGEVTAGRAAAERAAARAEAGGGFAEVLAAGLFGIALLLGGERGRAEPWLRRNEPLLDDAAFLERSYGAVWPAPLVLVWMEEHDHARDLFTRVIGQARQESVPSLLPYTLVGLAELDFRTGGWTRAYANAAEAVTLARQTGQPVSLAFALACLARVRAAHGRDGDCREHVNEAFALAAGGAASVVVYAAAGLGLLELGQGRIDEAIEHLDRVRTEVEAHGLVLPTVIQWAPDLIEALARAGRGEEAIELLASFHQPAEASMRTWAVGAASRCRGRLGAGR